MRFILKTTFGLTVVFWSFAFSSQLQAGDREDAEKAMKKFDIHYALIEKNGLWDFDRPSFQGKYFNSLFIKIELMEKQLELIAKGKTPKFDTQVDQLLDITVNALDDVKYHQEVIQDAIMNAWSNELHALTAFIKEDWSRCIDACHKAEADLAKIELHLPKYPQKAELARRAVLRVDRYLGGTKIGISSAKKSVNKSTK